jgi:hypothetical protein
MSTQIGHLVSAELIAALEKVFPLRRPLPTDDERGIWIKSGNREVIEFLQAQHDAAIEQSLGASNVLS